MQACSNWHLYWGTMSCRLVQCTGWTGKTLHYSTYLRLISWLGTASPVLLSGWPFKKHSMSEPFLNASSKYDRGVYFKILATGWDWIGTILRSILEVPCQICLTLMSPQPVARQVRPQHPNWHAYVSGLAARTACFCHICAEVGWMLTWEPCSV